MDPIETLMQEHRIIERGLDALEAWAAQVVEHREDDRGELGRFVQFIREFADACHHGKEEDILFSAMMAHGFERDAGPLAVMFAEHEEGRALVRALAELARQDAPWDDDDRRKLSATARDYASLLRRHILKEDEILYPLARDRLPEPTMDDVSSRFERFEAEETGEGEHERLHALAESLIARHMSDATGHGHAHEDVAAVGARSTR